MDDREPSYPDRARIDSDVRAFLKPASSPWIVFNRDSRLDIARSVIRAGVGFVSSPSYGTEPPSTSAEDELRRRSQLHTPVVITDADGRFYPPSTGPEEPAAEPSGLSVASDFFDEQRPAVDGEPGLPRPRRARRVAAGGIVALAAVAALVVVSARRSHPVAASSTAKASVVAAAPPPVVDPPRAPVVVMEPKPEPSAPAAVATAAPEAAGKKRFGKLTLKGDAGRKNVWFDGKRMLGTGTRSFNVLCGMHTVAVNEKAEAKDVEVPCSGELVVGK